ncbi:hypothetical protein Q4578_20270 [Shimia thalassica]|uniref:hypothetical protein n=1 Tax=Shimia thalassica TaxID=1715693 RepID=UPI0026E38DEF|nr:hypothetical protein [Shimia thalassica]MDO6523935.1 hypothetical protein [Shimia thalassica]
MSNIEGLIFFFVINAWPISMIVSYSNLRSKNREIISQIDETLLRQHGKRSDQIAEEEQPPPYGWGIVGFVAIVGFFIAGFLSLLPTAALWGIARGMSRWQSFVEPVIERHNAQLRQHQRHNAQAASQGTASSFKEPPPGDDDFFSSKAQSGKERARHDQKRRASSKAQDVPYGVDKRHPKDAKLWAKVDDPNASDGERQNAFAAILKRNAQRKQGQDPAPATDADVTLLLGSEPKS